MASTKLEMTKTLAALPPTLANRAENRRQGQQAPT